MEGNLEPTRSHALGHAPDQTELDAIVASIVKAVDPERIILFGSGARGTMNDESDLDILVVKDRCRPRGTTTRSSTQHLGEGGRCTSSSSGLKTWCATDRALGT